MSWLSDIFTGGGGNYDPYKKSAEDIGGFGTRIGEGDLSLSSDINRSLATGDQAGIARFLGPTMSAINKQGQEKNLTTAEFGNRSGGTNAGSQMVSDQTRAHINDLIAKLTGQSINNLQNIGEFGITTGLNANQQAADIEARKLKAEQDSLLGGMIGKGVGMAEDAALGWAGL